MLNALQHLFQSSRAGTCRRRAGTKYHASFEPLELRILLASDLQLATSVDEVAPIIGEEVSFLLKVTNNGPQDATGIQVDDALPSGLTFVGSSPSQGSYDANTGLWELGALANGDLATLELTATVTPGPGDPTGSGAYLDEFVPFNRGGLKQPAYLIFGQV